MPVRIGLHQQLPSPHAPVLAEARTVQHQALDFTLALRAGHGRGQMRLVMLDRHELSPAGQLPGQAGGQQIWV
jgi:hypothetical protein